MSAVTAAVQTPRDAHDDARLLPRLSAGSSHQEPEERRNGLRLVDDADPLDDVEPEVLELMSATDDQPTEFDSGSLPSGIRLEWPLLVKAGYGALQHRLEVAAISAREEAVHPDLDAIRSY